MLRQESELAQKRLVEEQHRRTSEVRQQLLAQLERIQLRVATVLAAQPEGVWPNRPEDPAVALVGWVHDSRLLLPWDTNPATKEFSKLLAEAPFSQKIREGEVAELSANRADAAADLYRQALALAIPCSALTRNSCWRVRWKKPDAALKPPLNIARCLRRRRR
jgi:hypothetical protein